MYWLGEVLQVHKNNIINHLPFQKHVRLVQHVPKKPPVVFILKDIKFVSFECVSVQLDRNDLFSFVSVCHHLSVSVLPGWLLTIKATKMGHKWENLMAIIQIISFWRRALWSEFSWNTRKRTCDTLTKTGANVIQGPQFTQKWTKFEFIRKKRKKSYEMRTLLLTSCLNRNHHNLLFIWKEEGAC